jgi:hypothetical protein
VKKALRLTLLIAALLSTASQLPATTFFSCSGFDGSACTSPGESFRCAEGADYGRCWCRSDYVWHCAW